MRLDVSTDKPSVARPESYHRWLAKIEPDPRDLLVPYPSEAMTMWPISTRVNKAGNDDAAILEPIVGMSRACCDQSAVNPGT
jgi:putative SOS response-associated peptidase YedK